MERRIAHIRIPQFEMQMEALRFPRLVNGRPVVLVPNTGARAIIRGVSAQARRAGVHKGMLLSTTKRFCRELEILPYDQPYYQSAGEELFFIAGTMSNVVERQFGKVFVDLSFAGSQAEKICYQAMQEIRRRLRIEAQLGVASNKTVSAVAAHVAGESKICHVKTGEERKFLRPFWARVLPVVDEAMWERLKLMGLDRVGSIADFRAEDLRVIFGPNGPRLHEQALGIDYTPVFSPRREQSKIFSHILSPDSNNIYLIRAQLLRLVETACREIRAENRHALRVALEIEYADSRITTKTKNLRQPASDDMTLTNAASELLEKTIRRRVGVRMISFSILALIPAMQQLSLFDAPLALKRRKIDAAMDAIRGRYGEGVIGYARI